MNLQNFRDWYVNILNDLYKNGNAGLAIMLIVLPLLERYLREKSGTHEDNQLNDKFYTDFQDIFPEIINRYNATSFWGVFRHGLLHQVAFSSKDYKGIKVPHGGLSNNVNTIEIIDGNIWVNPRMFAKRIIARIESDFPTFEGIHSEKHKLPTVGPILPSDGPILTTYQGTAAPDTWSSKSPDDKKKGG
jgi:hypothetical protein